MFLYDRTLESHLKISFHFQQDLMNVFAAGRNGALCSLSQLSTNEQGSLYASTSP